MTERDPKDPASSMLDELATAASVAFLAREEKPTNDVELQNRYTGPCVHVYGSVLDEASRAVTCRRCGKALDAFDVLVRVARDQDGLKRVRQEEREARKRLTALHAEERKAKARTKNASRKEASAAVAAEKARHAEQMCQITQWADEIGARVDSIQRATGKLPRFSRRRGSP